MTRYFVKDGNTLGYVNDAEPNIMGVLASNRDGHDPKNGPVSIRPDCIRPATPADLAFFRVDSRGHMEQQ